MIAVSIPQAVSTIAIGEWKKIILFKYGFSFNTASGKYYCNTNNFFIMNSFPPVSIPQAVSTIAIQSISLTNLAQMYQVSIPQAVSTIAIEKITAVVERFNPGFNTASGKYYCNSPNSFKIRSLIIRFQYRKR